MGDFPKQYYKVKDRMILEYTLDSFENAEAVDRIVIVMAPAWREKLETELRGKYRKLFGFAIRGPKSVSAPTPRNMRDGSMVHSSSLKKKYNSPPSSIIGG